MDSTSDAPTGVLANEARQRALRNILVGLGALLAVVLYGVLGYVSLGWSPGDAFYMVMITISGVGFTEVHPIESGWLRVHTVLVIVAGVVATGFTVTGILRYVTEDEIQRALGHERVRRFIDALSDHIIVAGLGRMGWLICSELAEAGVPFVLIEKSAEKGGEVGGRGWLYVVGDATEEKTLLDAGLHRARALVTAIPSDAANVFITLTARELAPEVRIVARAEQSSTQKKLRQAGADHVVLPAVIGAHRIVSILTNPKAVEFAELVTDRTSLALELDEVTVEAPGPFVGRSLRDADVGRRTGVIVIAVKRADGRLEFPPAGDEPFGPGDAIVLIGRRANLEQFREQFGRADGV